MTTSRGPREECTRDTEEGNETSSNSPLLASAILSPEARPFREKGRTVCCHGQRQLIAVQRLICNGRCALNHLQEDLANGLMLHVGRETEEFRVNEQESPTKSMLLVRAAL